MDIVTTQHVSKLFNLPNLAKQMSTNKNITQETIVFDIFLEMCAGFRFVLDRLCHQTFEASEV